MSGEASWQCWGESVLGATHRHRGVVNQDALWLNSQPPVGLALSDGHGSSPCFRSHLGSQFAVELVGQWLTRGLGCCAQNPKPGQPALKDSKALFQKLVELWNEQVDRHIQEYPFSTHEKLLLKASASEPQQRRLAYGATLLAASEDVHSFALLQLGDGDIVAVDPQGRPSRPMPEDARLFGDETTSLCLPLANEDFRSAFLSKSEVDLLLMATDGYGNSFKDPKGLEKMAVELWKIIREEGREGLRDLRSWLAETTAEGSGDDITVGLIVRSRLIGVGARV